MKRMTFVSAWIDVIVNYYLSITSGSLGLTMHNVEIMSFVGLVRENTMITI